METRLSRELACDQVARRRIQLAPQSFTSRLPNTRGDLRLPVHQAPQIGRIERQQSRGLQRDNCRGAPRLPQSGYLSEEIPGAKPNILVTQPDFDLTIH